MNLKLHHRNIELIKAPKKFYGIAWKHGGHAKGNRLNERWSSKYNGVVDLEKD